MATPTEVRPWDNCINCIRLYSARQKSRQARLKTRRRAFVCTGNTKEQRLRCDNCAEYHRTCEQMAEGCAGDGFDLFQLVSWSDGVMNRLVDGHSTISLLSDQEKRVVVQAVVALADAFEVAEKEHRHHYGMDLILTEREEAGLTVFYDDMITDRKALIPLVDKPAITGHSTQDQQNWNV